MDEAWAAARGNAGDVSRGGARQDSPEFGVFEVPGVGSSCGLAQEKARSMRNPLGWFVLRCGVWSGVFDGGGGSRQGSSPEFAFRLFQCRSTTAKGAGRSYAHAQN